MLHTARFHLRPIGPETIPALQALWNANPAYFQTVNGRNALPDEAQQEFDEYPPPEMPFGQRWFAGVFTRHADEAAEQAAGEIADEAAGELIGVVVLVSDLMVAGVWHITLFWLASAWHGQGAGQELWDGLEAWVRAQGAETGEGAAVKPGEQPAQQRPPQWLRLGVVRGNARAERFWARQGFTAVRERHGVDTGGRLNTLAVMVKPLHGQPLADYLALVARDRPESSLA